MCPADSLRATVCSNNGSSWRPTSWSTTLEPWCLGAAAAAKHRCVGPRTPHRESVTLCASSLRQSAPNPFSLLGALGCISWSPALSWLASSSLSWSCWRLWRATSDLLVKLSVRSSALSLSQLAIEAHSSSHSNGFVDLWLALIALDQRPGFKHGLAVRLSVAPSRSALFLIHTLQQILHSLSTLGSSSRPLAAPRADHGDRATLAGAPTELSFPKQQQERSRGDDLEHAVHCGAVRIDVHGCVAHLICL